MYLTDAFSQPHEVACKEHRICRQEVGERHHAASVALRHVLVEVGEDGYALFLVKRYLALHLEGSDARHLIAEEVDAERIFRRIGEHVDDATAFGILSRLIDVVGQLEPIAAQHVGDELHVDFLAHVERQRVAAQFFLADNLLCQGIGIGHYEYAPCRLLLQATQCLCAEYDVGGILLTILNGTAE